MMIKRKIVAELLRWKVSKNRKPLILRGARQVGKTFVVNHFAENFDHFIDINLERPRERDLFLNFNTGHELLERILLYKGISLPKDKRNTLLFIDEIQNSAPAIKALRYLYEDVEELGVIAAGSLLEVFSKQEGFAFPVGRVKNLFLYPVSFSEYLETVNSPLARKLSSLDMIHENTFHDILSAQFDEYAFLGGMPEILSVYLQSKSHTELKGIYDAIFMGYLEDVEKYSNIAKAKYLTHTIDRSSLYAGKRITYEKFGESSFRSREIKEAFDVLERALIIYRARPSTSIRLPLIEKMRKAPKLFFLDIGLMNFRIGLKEFFSQKQSLDIAYQGRISEQIVAQEIIAQTHTAPSLNFWIRDRGTAEIDFIYNFKGFVIPIEVKSGKSGTLRSLNVFMEKSDHPYAVRIYSGNSRIDRIELPSGKVFYLYSMPYYLLSRLDDVLNQFIEKVSLDLKKLPEK